MSLTVEKGLHESTIVLKLNGILDISTTNLIDPHLEELNGIEAVIIDFSALEFIDSTGIGSIMNTIFLSQEIGFKLKFQGIDELTHSVFETVGLYQILESVQGEVV